MILSNLKTFIQRYKFLVVVAFFALIFIIILLNILFWFKSTSGTEGLIKTIQYQEVVGVDEEKVVALGGKTTASAVSKYNPPYVNVDFTQLKKRNEEIVAWLKFDAVDISIPITQTQNNDYYLTHDVDKNPSKLGWVFADARSNMEVMGFNTVFYGHNNSNKQMFGKLKDILSVTKEEKSKKEIIQVTTPYSKQVYQIVSVYITNFEDWKYVDQIFVDSAEKQEFIDMIQERNTIEAFGSDISTMDRILTFSTCYGQAGTENRLVIHAKLVAEEWV